MTPHNHMIEIDDQEAAIIRQCDTNIDQLGGLIALIESLDIPERPTPDFYDRLTVFNHKLRAAIETLSEETP